MSSTTTPSTSAPLQLFPSPSSYLPPRKSSLKQPRSATSSSTASAPMRGVALQVTTSMAQTGVDSAVRSNNAYATPIVANSTPSDRGPSKRALHARKRSSAPTPVGSPAVAEPLVHEDQLCPLPVNTSFVQSSPPRIRLPTARLKRAAIPKTISTPSFLRQDATEMIDTDQLSPLPTRLTFKQTTPAKQEYPSPSSFRSDASTLVRSSSDATGRSPSSAASYQPPRSIFPQYDHTKSLSKQHYFPRAPAFQESPDAITFSQAEGNTHWPLPQRHEPVVDVTSGYEGVPIATAADLLTIWHASTTSSPPTGRKVQLRLNQPPGRNMSLTVGTHDTILYTMQAINSNPQHDSNEANADLNIVKSCPSSTLPMPVSQLSLPPNSSKLTATTPPTTLFPHQAALDAIQTAATTPLAAAIAATDPTGSSPAAARLAQNAVAQAQRQHTATIRRSARHRAAGTTEYTLSHSSLGSIAITVTPAGGEHKAKISLHHPRATPAAVSSQTLALLTLDFAAGVCILDTPSLLALDEPYILDVAVSAVLAVAVLENEICAREMVEFEPPPTITTTHAVDSGLKAGSGSVRRKAKRVEKKKRALESGKERGLVRETVGLVGLGVKGAVWLMGAGLKAARASAR
jgi:hypothetical protein